jgi:DNA-3-methyladenine glycosylase II
MVIKTLQTDPVLLPLLERYDLPKLKEKPFIYKDLIRSIISQQLSIKAAETIYNRFQSLLNEHISVPEKLLELTHDQLRGAGLSNQKASYVKHVATHFIEKNLMEKKWTNVPDEDILKTLTAIKGVGRWTAQMVLMFTLGRPDVFASGDLSIQQKMKALYGIEKERKELIVEIERIALAWQPYRTYACMYLWKWKDEG